jgi:hypothetical protein
MSVENTLIEEYYLRRALLSYLIGLWLFSYCGITENRGESPAVNGGDESDNTATIAGINSLDSVCRNKHNEQKLVVGLGSARTTEATTPFPRGRL